MSAGDRGKRSAWVHRNLFLHAQSERYFKMFKQTATRCSCGRRWWHGPLADPMDEMRRIRREARRP